MNEERPADSPTDSPFIDYKEVDILEHSRVSDNSLLKSTLRPSPDFRMMPSLDEAIEQESDHQPEALSPQADTTPGLAGILTFANFEDELESIGLTLEQAAQYVDEVPLAALEHAAMHPQGNFNLQELAKINPFRLTEALESSLYYLALNPHGTRVIQRLIETVESDGQLLIACELQGHVRELIFSQNGNHCISRVFEHFEQRNIVFAVQECVSFFMPISRHCHGCCIIQKCIARSGDYYAEFFKLTAENAVAMVTDEYANFVYQCVLDEEASMDKLALDPNELIAPLIGLICSISFEKASSHVAEKIVQRAHGDVFEDIERQVLSDRRTLIAMCCDRFGNYVIERLLQRNTAAFVAGLNGIKAELRGQQYAKFILNFLGD